MDIDERHQEVIRYAAHLGFRSPTDLINALGLDPAPNSLAANEP
jgi:hypothetical protein